MNKQFLLLTAAVAAAMAGAARADEADGSQFALKFQGSRTRAEVAAEAATVPTTRSTEPAGSRVAAPVRSTVDVQTVKAETIEAVRAGKIPSGEFSL